MSAEDKMKHAAQKVGGRAQQAAGDLTGDKKLKAKGKITEAKGRLGGAMDRVEDAAEDAGDDRRD